MSERWRTELAKLKSLDGPPAEVWERARTTPPRLSEPSRRTRVIAGVVALAVFALAATFAWSAFQPGRHEPHQASGSAVKTNLGGVTALVSSQGPSGADALLRGTLTTHLGCLGVATGPGAPVLVVWPRGYGLVEQDGHISLADDSGTPVAKPGDPIQMGGASTALRFAQAAAQEIPSRCQTGRPDAYFIAGRPYSARTVPQDAGLCEQQAMSGDVNGDGTPDVISLGKERREDGSCPKYGNSNLLLIDLGGDGSIDVRSHITPCVDACPPFALVDIGDDGRDQILVWQGHLGPQESGTIGVYELRGSKLEPVLFPSGTNRFLLVNSSGGYLGAFCSVAQTFTTWKGTTDDVGTLKTLSSRTYRFDPATLSFSLVSVKSPVRATRIPHKWGTAFNGHLCGSGAGLG